jgi:DNA adenine methylase
MPDIRDLWNDLDGLETKKRGDRLRPPIAYPGSKSRIVPDLLEIIPLGKSYIEPFGGGAALLLARPRVDIEVYNDAYGGIVDFWRCVQDPDLCSRMLDICDGFLHAREIFEDQLIVITASDDITKRAAAWFYTTKMSFGGLGRNWARETTGKQVTFDKFRRSLVKMGPIRNRLRGVQIERTDWKNIFKDFDSPDAVFFIDPPYLGDYQGTYKNESIDHELMLETIFDMEAYCAVCGRPSELYDRYHWSDEHTFERRTSVGGKTHGIVQDIKGIEKVWIKEAHK